MLNRPDGFEADRRPQWSPPGHGSPRGSRWRAGSSLYGQEFCSPRPQKVQSLAPPFPRVHFGPQSCILVYMLSGERNLPSVSSRSVDTRGSPLPSSWRCSGADAADRHLRQLKDHEAGPHLQIGLGSFDPGWSLQGDVERPRYLRSRQRQEQAVFHSHHRFASRPAQSEANRRMRKFSPVSREMRLHRFRQGYHLDRTSWHGSENLAPVLPVPNLVAFGRA